MAVAEGNRRDAARDRRGRWERGRRQRSQPIAAPDWITADARLLESDMSTITLPSLSFLAARQVPHAQAAAQARRGDNVQEAVTPPAGWLIGRLHRHGQLDPDWIISDVLQAAARRLYVDWCLSRGRASDAQAERLATFKAATAALGQRYTTPVRAIVLDGIPLGTVGSARYENRSAAGAFALEQLNVGLRRLSVHYGLLARD